MPNTAGKIGLAVALLILGAAGYAYKNPAFASACKASGTTCATWALRQAGAAQAAFERSAFYASYVRALGDHKLRASSRKEKGKKEASAAAARQAPPLDMSPEAVRKREQANWSIGQKIAYGPAFAQHGKEFGFKTEDQMAFHIDRVVGYAGPSTTKVIAGGRTVYWDDRTHSVVIVEANQSGGTMYRPNEGYPFFKDLKPVP